MDSLNLAVSISALVITTLTIERTMKVFFAKRKSTLVITVLSYIFFLIALALSIHEIVDVIIHFLALAAISLNYESAPVKRMAAVAVSHHLIISITDINTFIAGFLPTTWIIGGEVLALIITCLFIYFVALLVFPLFRYIKKTTINLNKLWLPLIIFPMAYTFIMLFRNIDTTSVVLILVLFNTSGTILIFLFLYNILSKIVEDTLKSALHSQEKEYYFTQCQLMQESMEKVKSIRHDMKIHLATLKDYTIHNKAATDYLNSLLGDIGESEVYSDTGNIAFDSIINFKLKNAKEDNIKLDLRIAVPPVINIEVSDIVTVIGNLLDNALEAVSKVNDKIIKLDIEFGKGSLFAKVDNSFNGDIKYLEDKTGTEKRIITLKDGAGHGYGLKNIKQSVEKYNGHMKISHTDNIFSAGILLYVDCM